MATTRKSSLRIIKKPRNSIVIHSLIISHLSIAGRLHFYGVFGKKKKKKI